MVDCFRRCASVCALVLLAGAWSLTPAVAQDTLRPVKLFTATQSEIALERTFFGRIIARQTVDLAFQVGGQILELPAVEGTEWQAGDLIAELDLEPFQLALDQATARADQANRTLTRFQTLQGAAVSEVAVQDAQTEARLADLAVRDAERALRLATLDAPFDGIVAIRHVDNFTTIAAGTPVVRLHDMSEIRVEIDVPEILFQRAGADPDIEIVGVFPVSDRAYPLITREFVAETSPVGQTYLITLAFLEQPEAAVLPGTSVTVYVQLKSDAQAIRLPAASIIDTADGGTSVFIFTPTEGEAGILSLRPVDIYLDADGNIEVLEGIEAGEQIVAAGANLLEDGQQVIRFTGFGD